MTLGRRQYDRRLTSYKSEGNLWDGVRGSESVINAGAEYYYDDDERNLITC